MAKQLLRWVSAAQQFGLILPPVFEARIRPQRVARAIVGHLLAAEERRDRFSPLAEGTAVSALRNYFLDPTAVFPSNMAIYVWPYVHEDIVIARDFITARLPLTAHLLGSVLKFRPWAFWLVMDTSEPLEIRLARLPLYPELQIDDEVEFQISLVNRPASTWPERPGPDEMILGSGERTFLAQPVASGL